VASKQLVVHKQLVVQLLQLDTYNFKNRGRPWQYGFRAAHSTTMAILAMVERVRRAWNSKNVALGVFIDLKKAFNMVDHGVLLAKLEHYGVRERVLELLASYLRGRFQYVVFNGGWRGIGQAWVVVWDSAGFNPGAFVFPPLCQ
jgi:hypothetical protein